ncbi:hypothetical protein B0H11DRAFT_2255613 [Mycena galericulata]|nr:hypothetical protein B0H11DRAFT_2255613 [Mycena galericulata]
MSVPPFHVRKVEQRTAGQVLETPELAGIVDVLSKAFSTDAFAAIITTGHPPNSPVVNPLVRSTCQSTAISGLLDGEVYVAETPDAAPKIIGCAVWFKPGHGLYETLSKGGSKETFPGAIVGEALPGSSTLFLPQYLKSISSALGEGAEAKYWRLQTLGVAPEYQRQGIGKLLVNMIKKSPICVDCSAETNVDVYERLGFSLMPKEQQGSRDACREEFTGLHGDKFSLWVLTRDIV